MQRKVNKMYFSYGEDCHKLRFFRKYAKIVFNNEMEFMD